MFNGETLQIGMLNATERERYSYGLRFVVIVRRRHRAAFKRIPHRLKQRGFSRVVLSDDARKLRQRNVHVLESAEVLNVKVFNIHAGRREGGGLQVAIVINCSCTMPNGSWVAYARRS